MANTESNKKFFDEFPPVSTKEWEDKIKADLKGADYDKKLKWRTLEGITMRPYYRTEDMDRLSWVDSNPGEFPFTRGNKVINNQWLIRQDIKVTDYSLANSKTKSILEKGVNSIGFILDAVPTDSEMQVLLNDIPLNDIEINWITEHGITEILDSFISYVKGNGYDATKLEGSVNCDVLGYLSINGEYEKSYDSDWKKTRNTVEKIKRELPSFSAITVHADYFHNSGASITQELAFALAAGNEYISKLTDTENTLYPHSICDVTGHLKFSFAVGANYFMEIAKFRAARMLWSKIVDAYQPTLKETTKMKIHAETSAWNKTVYDPYVNMLRSTTEAMSAVLAGIHSFTVAPFNRVFQTPDEFSERIARNTQLILKEEAHFDKVIDPAAGSYYIENMTDAIAEEAWKLFQAVEEKGGYIEAFKNGFIQEAIEQTAQKRDMNIATGKDKILGTNQFPNSTEKRKDEINPEMIENDCQSQVSNTTYKPLRLYRGAAAFEALRLKTELSEIQPKVFMLTYGDLTMRKARASFSSSFFACAGFEVINNTGFETPEAGVQSAITNEADIVVICSSDGEYTDIVIPVYEQLKDDAIIVVAGYPKDCIDKLQDVGVKHFIHLRSNILETLKEFQKELGI